MIRRNEDERGAVLALASVTMLALLLMAAMLIDFGSARAEKRNLSSVADLAVLAGGGKLTGTNAVEACVEAFNTLGSNLPAFRGSSSPCNELPVNCVNPSTVGLTSPPVNPPAPATQPKSVVIQSGDYTATFRYPVSDYDVYDPSIPYPNTSDGRQCQRLSVTVAHLQKTAFSGLWGESTMTPSAKAIVRMNPGSDQLVPALWLLDPKGCAALDVTGGSTVNVGTTGIRGVISIDSDGSECSNNDVTISASNNSHINAVPLTGSTPGSIQLFAMPPWAVECSGSTYNDCEPGDVSGGNLSPQPIASSRRATRAPIDHRYNCNASYPDYKGISLTRCPDVGAVEPYIDNLRTLFNVTGNKVNANAYTGAPLPGSWTRWTNCNPGTTSIVGNVWIDCPGGFSIGNGTDFTVTGNVVLDGTLKTTGGSFNVNANTAAEPAQLSASCLATVSVTCSTQYSATAAVMFQRKGDIDSSGGVIRFRNTAVVQNGGCLSINGGSPPYWHGPTEGPFEGLAYWSEKCSTGKLNGGGSLDLGGTFFMPDTTFAVSGGSPAAQQHAQFVSYRMAVSGGGTMTLVPDPVSSVRLSVPKGLLIR